MNRKVGLTVYSLGHLLVDGACCLIMLVSAGTGKKSIEILTPAIILYNTVAFALQPFFGLFADKKGGTNVMACTGCILIGFSAFFISMPYAAAVIAGLGNATYHIGGGIYSLNMDRGKAAYAGIFVAPGAVGLFLGELLANATDFHKWFILVPMTILGVSVLSIRHIPRGDETTAEHGKEGFWALPLLLLTIVIVLRSVIGSACIFPWENTEMSGLILVTTVTLGKAAGGIVSDFADRRKTVVSALLLSAPLLAFCESGILTSLAGLFLFNLTMAVTLVEIADRLDGYSGFAFGLTTLALILGMFMIYFGWKEFFGMPWVTFTFIVLSAVLLFIAVHPDKNKIINKGVHYNEKESV